MRDYRLILELGSDADDRVPLIVHQDIQASTRRAAQEFAATYYPPREGWELVDVIDIIQGF